jgi:hypothetical protein
VRRRAKLRLDGDFEHDRQHKTSVSYNNALDLCLIASFSRWTVPFEAGLSMNSATKARPMSSCSIVPKRPGIRRPSQATYPGV